MSHPADSSTSADFARDGLPADPAAESPQPVPERSRLTHRPFGAGEDQSFIDQHSSFSGKYESTRDLLVEGTAEGEIECEGRLTVAESATIKARVTAADITVAGILDGEITCHGLLEVLPSGRVQGTLTTDRLVVQEGAYCDGTIHMQTREPDKTPTTGDDKTATTGDNKTASPTSIFKSPVRKVE